MTTERDTIKYGPSQTSLYQQFQKQYVLISKKYQEKVVSYFSGATNNWEALKDLPIKNVLWKKRAHDETLLAHARFLAALESVGLQNSALAALKTRHYQDQVFEIIKNLKPGEDVVTKLQTGIKTRWHGFFGGPKTEDAAVLKKIEWSTVVAAEPVQQMRRPAAAQPVSRTKRPQISSPCFFDSSMHSTSSSASSLSSRSSFGEQAHPLIAPYCVKTWKRPPLVRQVLTKLKTAPPHFFQDSRSHTILEKMLKNFVSNNSVIEFIREINAKGFNFFPWEQKFLRTAALPDTPVAYQSMLNTVRGEIKDFFPSLSRQEKRVVKIFYRKLKELSTGLPKHPRALELAQDIIDAKISSFSNLVQYLKKDRQVLAMVWPAVYEQLDKLTSKSVPHVGQDGIFSKGLAASRVGVTAPNFTS